MATDPETAHLFGACACERNQYTVTIPPTFTSRAQVFFDNTALSRRAQASPVTAWLRVPLSWYSSTTIAHFPDESHSSIKRTFHTPPSRRQFCGYCGSHLTQWDESARQHGEDGQLDVTLGSLLHESLERLEALRILPELETEDEGDGLVTGGMVNEEDHIPTEESTTGAARAPHPPHLMSNRGMPYFEELVENSRLGKIKRQVGGHTSRDGNTRVQWEIIEIGGGTSSPPQEGETQQTGTKRPRLDV